MLKAEGSHGPSCAQDEKETYQQRTGTRSVGDKYENIMLALYALRFSLNKNVKDMSIESNVDGFGAFDDVKLQVEYYSKETKLYLIQLKHKEKENYPIRKSELLSSKNNNFSLDKYKKSYYKVRSKLGSEGYNLDEVIICLVTNANLPNISTISLEPSHVICHLVSNPIQNLQEDYIHTKSKNFFTFNIQSTEEELEYSTFFRHFRFYDKQVNYKEAENEIVSLLETSFGVENPEIIKTFIRFIEAECEGKRPLTKKNVKIKLLELLTGVTEEMLLFTKYETFKDITDLNNYDERVKILKEISISLQGRTAVNLYDLTNKSFHETVSVSFLLKNIKETVNVGSKFLKRPDKYIERRFFKILLEKEILSKTTKMIFLLDTPLPPALTGEIKILTDLETNNFLSCRFTDENLAVIVSTNAFSETIKCIKKHRDLTSFSLHHVKVYDTRYLEWQRSWSNRDDLSKFIVYEEPVKEEEILKYFKSNLNVVSANPGMGKTTILNTLAHYCEPDVLALKLDLKTHERDLRNGDSELRQNPLHYICERMQTGENSEIEKELFKHLKEENRLILFVDAFDEISPMHSNAVLSIIEKLKENQIPTWIFTRPLVMSILQKHFSIVPFNMVPLGNDDIKNYLIQTVGVERDEEVDSSLTDHVLNLCSAPLYLNMFGAIIMEKQVNLRDLKMTDLYEHFTEMSYKNYMKKLNADEDTNGLVHIWKSFKETYINVHKTTALVVIFEEIFLLENEILKEEDIKDIRDFNTGEKNYELIVFEDDGTPTFSHRTYAEYFAALKIYEYLQEKKFHVLYKHLFKEKFQGVRAMFDRISAKTLPLHLEVVEEDFAKVERLCDDLSSSKIHERDEFGRTVLHFAMNSCKFSDFPVEENVPIKIVDLLMRYCKKDKAIFKERDGILHLNFYEHAKKCESVNLLHFAAYHGNRNIVECLIDMEDASIDLNIKSEMGKTPIHLAAENRHFDIVTLLKDNGGNIDETDHYGWTALHYATYQRDEECVDLLIKAGAVVNNETKDNLAPIHYAAANYLLGQGVDINGEDSNGKRAVHLAAENGRVDIIKLLKQNGAYIYDVDLKGMTLLHYASKNGFEDCVDYLINQGADVDQKENEGKTPMHYAAENGHVNVMKILQKYDIIDDTDSDGWTALHYASYFGHKDCVQYLISKDADVNKKTKDLSTPVHYAAKGGYVDVIRLLKDNGGIIDGVNKDGLTPLHYAAINRRTDCFEYLIKSSEDINKAIDGGTPLHFSVAGGHVDVLKSLKEKGGNIYETDLLGTTPLNDELKRLKKYVNKETVDGRKPLHDAISNRDLGTVRLLLKEIGARIDDTDSLGMTGFHRAVSYGWTNCLNDLIKAGADVNKAAIGGRIPIHSCAESGYTDVIRVLIKNGGNINETDSLGQTALHYASCKGQTKCVKYLLGQGLDVNGKDSNGKTSMHLAAKKGHVDVMKLLQKEAEVINEKIINDTNSDGWTALHYASDCGHEDCVQYLISKDADVNKKTKDLSTPIHYAAQGGYVDVIRLLKDNGGIIDEVDEHGFTPLHYAASKGRISCVEHLTKSGADINKSDLLGRTPMHHAAEGGHVNVMKILQEGEEIINEKIMNDTDSKGLTALHYASSLENKDCVQYSISKDADVNKKTEDFSIPMHCAAEGDCAEVIRLLKDNGGIIDGVNKDGLTPLHCAALKGRISCVKHLIKSGADINKSDLFGITPMHYAAVYGHVNVMKILQEEEEIINEKTMNDTDSKGRTALLYASSLGHKDCVQYLISKDADVNKKTENFRTPMHYAAAGGYEDIIGLLKDNGGIIDEVDEHGFTPLHYAALEGYISCVEHLTKSGADVNKRESFGRTPMHHAARNGHVDVIKFLKHENVNIHDVDSNGWTAIHYAARKGNIKCLKFLLEAGADVNRKANDGRTPMHSAAANGHVNVMKILEEEVEGINEKIINDTDSDGWTALHIASCFGRKDCVQYLISKDVDINRKTNDGGTPMHYAALNGHVNVMKILQEEDEIINEKIMNDTDSKGLTALHYASSSGHKDCVQFLISKDADVNKKANDLRTPMHCAAKGGYVDVIRLLKDNGGIIDKFDRYGLTPLHYAAKTGRIDCFEYLTESDEDFYISDPLGMTPIHYAAENGHIDVIKYLKHKNVNITGIDSEGLTALHYATRNGQVKCVRYLIEEKFDVNKSTNLGETPMSYAVQRNYVNVISLLIEKEARITDFNSEGLTVLHYAAQHGCKHSLAYLLESGASSKQKSRDDRTPMHYAAENGHVDIIKLLKKKDAEIDAVDSKGLIPLHYAAREGNIKCINHLIKSSEDINKKAIDGGTPVHFSAEGGHVDVLKSLKEKGGNINETDSLGQTALHYASCKGQTKCVEYLLGQCLDVNGKDSNGKTPMHCAAENGHLEVIRVLKEKYGNVNETDMLGRTPFHYAKINGHANCMKYLIRAGATIDQKVCDGSTPLSLAVENGHADAVKLLEDEGAIV